MSQLLLSLGAINKLTGDYVYPKIANKKDKYICSECNKDLILVQGEIRVHHFRHVYRVKQVLKLTFLKLMKVQLFQWNIGLIIMMN